MHVIYSELPPIFLQWITKTVSHSQKNTLDILWVKPLETEKTPLMDK